MVPQKGLIFIWVSTLPSTDHFWDKWLSLLAILPRTSVVILSGICWQSLSGCSLLMIAFKWTWLISVCSVKSMISQERGKGWKAGRKGRRRSRRSKRNRRKGKDREKRKMEKRQKSRGKKRMRERRKRHTWSLSGQLCIWMREQHLNFVCVDIIVGHTWWVNMRWTSLIKYINHRSGEGVSACCTVGTQRHHYQS